MPDTIATLMGAIRHDQDIEICRSERGVCVGRVPRVHHLHRPRRRTRAKPNVLYLLADQWCAAATGYAGDPNVKTPHLDRLANQSVNFTHAISGCPVCSPHRASLMTGQFPLTNGVFMNDLHLRDDATCLAEVFQAAGYDTGYIGKWHLNGRGRSNYIPPESRQGFDYWKVLECTHNYNHSFYYAGNDPTKRTWPGYDAIAQTQDAMQYIKDHAGGDKPFLLFLSWGPPHNPYQTAPQKYRAMYDPDKLELRPNVPVNMQKQTRRDLAGYYAHCTALDGCIGELVENAGRRRRHWRHHRRLQRRPWRDARLTGPAPQAEAVG